MSGSPHEETWSSVSSSSFPPAPVSSSPDLYGEASTSSSPISSPNQIRTGDDGQLSTAFQSDDYSVRGDAVRRRHKLGHSGGFLLDTSTSSLAGTSEELKRHGTYSDGLNKGKERDSFVRPVSRRERIRNSMHRAKGSIGSSPLALEVTNAASQDEQGLDGSNSSGTGTQGRVYRQLVRDPNHGIDPQVSVFDTDPAQIVNLALNLSESRRRHISTNRLAPFDPSHSRRLASMGQSTTFPPIPMRGESMRAASQQQKRSSRNTSPRLLSERSGGMGLSSKPWQGQSQKAPGRSGPGFEFEFEDGVEFNPSDATLIRAEKARLSLEMLYEYRRLLQHLPKLPVSQEGRPSSKGLTKNSIDQYPAFGRLYNPLQYIRNRKVRGREKRSFDVQADGWKSIDKVRSWVDAVTLEHENNETRVGRLASLFPIFSAQEIEPNLPHDPPLNSSARHETMPKMAKQSRPRTDWITKPWDLLADANWLGLEEHQRLVEDREGHKLFSTFKTRNESALRHSQDTSRTVQRDSTSTPSLNERSGKPLLGGADVSPVAIEERGRRRHQPKNSMASANVYSDSHDRKPRWPRGLIRSQSSSSSEGPTNRLRPSSQFRDRPSSQERQDNALLEKQVLDLLAKEAANLDWIDHEEGNFEPTGGQGKSKDSMMAHNGNGGTTPFDRQFNESRHTSLQGERKLAGTLSQDDESPPGRTHRAQRSPEDLDSTAPNSPAKGRATVPSIAINSSSSNIRSISPPKPLPSAHTLLRKEANKGRHSLDSSRVVLKPVLSAKPPKTSSTFELGLTRTTDDKFLSPKSVKSFGKSIKRRRSDSKLFRAIKDKDRRENDSRFRNILKGKKLAGIVGHPVHKVGDFIWGKYPTNESLDFEPPAGDYNSEPSGPDGDEDGLVENMSSQPSHADIHATGTDYSPTKTGNGEAVKYHNSNLPIFKSASKHKGKDTNVPSMDHNAFQPSLSQGSGHTDGFQRLAPPNLDMKPVTPTLSPSPSLAETSTVDEERLDSRRSSGTPLDLARDQSNRRFAIVDGLPRTLGLEGGVPVTGLAQFGIQRHQDFERSKTDGSPGWNITDRGFTACRGVITNKDIARTKALLFSSAVKANEILRRAEETRDPSSKLLQDLQRFLDVPVPRVPRLKENYLAARLMDEYIERSDDQLRVAAEHLSNDTVSELHEKIKTIEERLNTKLERMVRSSADEADAMTIELSTSYRPSIKQLNDSIDLIMRRRRRRFRLVERGAYVLLEWSLLALFWWVWLIVVIIRLIRGVLRGAYQVTRWMLWL